MECWEFPPRYDANYRPDPSSRYWFPRRETMPAGDRERAILERLKLVCAYAYERSAFYREKWNEAGFHPSQLRSLEDFEARVPVITKADLRAAQARAQPGDAVLVDEPGWAVEFARLTRQGERSDVAYVAHELHVEPGVHNLEWEFVGGAPASVTEHDREALVRNIRFFGSRWAPDRPVD